MAGQMHCVCLGRVMVYQFVFAVVVRFVTAAAGAMLMSVVMSVVVRMLMSMIVVVAV